MTLAISDAARNAACNSVVDLIDGGSGAGTIEFRTGAAPASPGDPDSGTLLATLTFTDPAFGAASSGQATADAIASDTDVDTSGTPGHFRVKDSAGNVIMQGSVGLTGAGADAEFDSVTWVEGGTVAISAMTVTMPAS